MLGIQGLTVNRTRVAPASSPAESKGHTRSKSVRFELQPSVATIVHADVSVKDSLPKPREKSFRVPSRSKSVTLDSAHGIISHKKRGEHTPKHTRSTSALYPSQEKNGKQILSSQRYLFVLSGKTQQACVAQIAALKQYLNTRNATTDEIFLESLSYTLCLHRPMMEWRCATSASSLHELQEKLHANMLSPQPAKESVTVGFMFTGQGSQWYAMGRELFTQHGVFRLSLLKADNVFRRLGARWSLFDELTRPPTTSRVTLADPGQSLLTAIQIALVDLLASWKVRPSSVVGHSSGEIAAAYAAGILDFDSALRIAFWRGTTCRGLQISHPEFDGTMLAVALSEAQTLTYIKKSGYHRHLSIASVDSASSVTVSGDRRYIAKLDKTLKGHRVMARLLPVDTAYHSYHMKHIAQQYFTAIKNIVPRQPRRNCSFFSSLTGNEIPPTKLDASYWIENLGSRVRFSEALQRMCQTQRDIGLRTTNGGPLDVLIEIGPHPALAGPAKQITQLGKKRNLGIQYIPTLSFGQDAEEAMLSMACELWAAGGQVSLQYLSCPSTETPRVPEVRVSSVP